MTTTDKPSAGDWPPPFEMMKLQARKRGGTDWTDIFPAQLEWMAKEGNEVRAIESPPVAGAEAVLDSYAEENQRLSDRIEELEARLPVAGAEVDARYWAFRKTVEELVFDPIRRGGRTEGEIINQLKMMSEEHYAKPNCYTDAALSVAGAEVVQIQARKIGQGEWTDIFPAQVQQFSKLGYEIRATELTAVAGAEVGVIEPGLTRPSEEAPSNAGGKGRSERPHAASSSDTRPERGTP